MNRSIFFSIFFSLFFNVGCQRNFKKIYYADVKPDSFSGIITSMDSSGNHGIPVIYFKNRNGDDDWYGVLYPLHRFWDYSQIGDSIYKAKNSLAFKLIKKDTTYIFYPIYKGDTLK